MPWAGLARPVGARNNANLRTKYTAHSANWHSPDYIRIKTRANQLTGKSGCTQLLGSPSRRMTFSAAR